MKSRILQNDEKGKERLRSPVTLENFFYLDHDSPSITTIYSKYILYLLDHSIPGGAGSLCWFAVDSRQAPKFAARPNPREAG